MKRSEFRHAVAQEFGQSYGEIVTRDLSVRGLEHLTADQALSEGISPQRVWAALCEEMDVPETRRVPSRLPEPPE